MKTTACMQARPLRGLQSEGLSHSSRKGRHQRGVAEVEGTWNQQWEREMKTPTTAFYSLSCYEYINQEVCYPKFTYINQFLLFFSLPSYLRSVDGRNFLA